MVKRCAVCEREFEVLRGTRKTCSDKCRQRAYRAPKKPAVLEIAAEPAPGVLVEATRKRLSDAGRLDSELGVVTMILAARIDNLGKVETGAGVAALMREYRTTLVEAMRDADTAGDPLEEIRTAAALRLIHTA